MSMAISVETSDRIVLKVRLKAVGLAPSTFWISSVKETSMVLAISISISMGISWPFIDMDMSSREFSETIV